MTKIDIQAGLAGFFTQDHRDCDNDWAEVEALLDSGDAGAAAGAWQAFDTHMRRHLAMEEDVLFPAFESRSGMGGGGPTAVMRMEHQQMRSVLDQIGENLAGGDLAGALDLGDTLLMLIQQHNIKEEGMLYPMAENMLAAEWAEMAGKLENY